DQASARDILETLEETTQEHLTRVKWRELWLQALESQSSSSIGFTSLFCSDYPSQLRQLQEPPLILSYIGKPLWQSRLVSVVGSRRPTENSLRWMTYHLPAFLKSCQLSVVSGGARGVDQWAHKLSIQSGQG